MPKKILPISPEEAKQSKVNDFPDTVIETWNKIIVKNLNRRTAIVYQKEVVAALSSAMSCKADDVFSNGWLDIESLYSGRGWHVKYDKPAYNETYDAFFTFEIKKG